VRVFTSLAKMLVYFEENFPFNQTVPPWKN